MFKPIGERVLVEPASTKEKTKGGIILPDAAKEAPKEGTVVATGTGKRLDDGSMSKFHVNKGDTIMFSNYAGNAIKLDDKEYLVMFENDILGVVEE